MTTTLTRLTLSGAAVLALNTAACTDKVFVERELWEEPPSAAQGFLGYSDANAGLPTCGNCHIGQNSKWQGTAHAHAWATLQESGSAQKFCEGCHTVGANGNAVTETNVGWTATDDERYLDVQCESCHGPGLLHVTNPDATQPLASILVGVGFTNGCGECHQGAHHGFVDEWAESRHGEGANRPQYRERADGGCRNCHGGRGALEAWGVRANYLERDTDEPFGIVCGVCHDPHDATYAGQLRFPVDVPDVDVNLCMKCHQRRSIPDMSSQGSGPHSPQGPLLLGENVGWIPPNFQYGDAQIRGTHGTERNQRLCATCHVNAYEVTDAATGEFVLSVKGHSFEPIPCLDGQGVPDASAECELTERTFSACTTSGCHGDQAAARGAYIVATTRIVNLVEELEALLDQVPATEFVQDDILTTAEGARFNRGLGRITSSAIHNPFLTEALLIASIRQVRDDYGLAAVKSVSLQPLLIQPR
ncbi:MAG: cytochrome c3 family protein [Longimicrobiales bacterium]|nr:cytochrome c3 family protein [Longimicrobiales bacterium]